MDPIDKRQEALGRGDPAAPMLRFGVFQFQSGELRLLRNGYDVKLQKQPALVLRYLLARAGRIVSREELRSAIWPSDTYVEFDLSLNTTVNRLRRTLGDSASEPRYIETIPKQGYRWVAPLEIVMPQPPAPAALGPVLVQAAAAAPALDFATETPERPIERPAEHDPKQSQRPWRIWLAGVAVSTMLALGAFFWLRSRTTIQAPVIRYTISLPGGHDPMQVAISPNGDQIVYHDRTTSMLYRRFLASTESYPIPGSESGEVPFFSPDGKALAFFLPGKIRVLRESGQKDLGPIPPTARTYGFWGEDGYLYFNAVGLNSHGVETPGIWRIAEDSGKPELVLESEASPRGWAYRLCRQLLPHGLLFSVNVGPESRSIDYREQSDGSIHRLVERGMGGQVLPTGHLLYYWNGSLMAVPFDAQERKLQGSPVEAVRDVAQAGWIGGAAAVSRTGTLVYLKQPPLPHRRLVWVTADGREAVVPIPPAAYEQAEASPDGAQIALVRRDELRRWSVWILNLATHVWTKLLDSPAERPRVVWSPDSQSLAISLAGPGEEFVNLHRVSINAPEKPERLTNQPDFGQYPASWSKAANAILYQQGIHPHSEADIWLLPLSGLRRPRLLVATPGIDRSPSFSPDGRWFTYSNSGGVMVQDVAQSSPPRSMAAGALPLWSAAGRIYFVNPGGGLSEITVDGAGHGGEPHVLMAAGFTQVRDLWTRPYSMGADGRFLVIRDSAADRSANSQIEVVVNWFTELAGLAPRR